ncbi:hypothetical protein PTTG_10085, partial [Puccinia triticina 1-1 BBBD Race 1]|uniref:Uncharacterized protein n=1 Tax=Puccinia triticina (isolate 1-1 / race 1 (BBBD)) TaxID=630390 RepID=A0A0C4FA44_PUCT1
DGSEYEAPAPARNPPSQFKPIKIRLRLNNTQLAASRPKLQPKGRSASAGPKQETVQHMPRRRGCPPKALPVLSPAHIPNNPPALPDCDDSWPSKANHEEPAACPASGRITTSPI